MSKPALLGLLATALAVLVLVGSMLAGLGPADGSSVDAAEEPQSAAAAEERVRVEVLNAAGLPGLARAATERLRAAGLDVVYYGNAPSFGRDTSLVLDRSGRPDAARDVAEAAGIETVLERPDTTLYLDVTVIIGRDWVGIPPREEAAADSLAG